jgi:hypothetical protein
MLLSRIKKEIKRELSIKDKKTAFKSAIMMNKDNSLNTLVVGNQKGLKRNLT